MTSFGIIENLFLACLSIGFLRRINFLKLMRRQRIDIRPIIDRYHGCRQQVKTREIKSKNEIVVERSQACDKSMKMQLLYSFGRVKGHYSVHNNRNREREKKYTIIKNRVTPLSLYFFFFQLSTRTVILKQRKK